MPTSTNTPKNPHHEGEAVDLKLADGEKLMEIKPNDLSIVWGKDNRYWNVQDKGPAELYQVSWLEVTGCVSKTEAEKEYEVGFHISLTPDAFGWSGSPIYILVKRGKSGKFKRHKFTLETSNDKYDIKAKATKLIENEGNINLDADNNNEDNSKIYFGLYEVWRGNWKGGLKIHHAFIKEI